MELYWLLRLPHLHDLLCLLTALSFFGVVLALIIFGCAIKPDPTHWFDIDTRWARPYKWLLPTSIAIFVIIGILSCLCPDKTDLALMLGWDALKSNSVQEVIEILKDKIR